MPLGQPWAEHRSSVSGPGVMSLQPSAAGACGVPQSTPRRSTGSTHFGGSPCKCNFLVEMTLVQRQSTNAEKDRGMQDDRSSSWNGMSRTQAPPRVAVVGGGIAGLTCAVELRLRGCDPVVFEAGDRLGGRCSSRSTRVGLFDDGAQCIGGATRLSARLGQARGESAALHPWTLAATPPRRGTSPSRLDGRRRRHGCRANRQTDGGCRRAFDGGPGRRAGAAPPGSTDNPHRACPTPRHPMELEQFHERDRSGCRGPRARARSGSSAPGHNLGLRLEADL